MQDSAALTPIMMAYRGALGLLALPALAAISGCSPAAPSPTDRTIEVRGGVGATGSGTVSVYSPRFQPGAQHLGTCVLDPGSAPCKFVITHTSGTLELLANSVGGSTFTTWGIACATATGNSCIITLDATSSYIAAATFTIPMESVLLPVDVFLDVRGSGNAAAVLQSDQGDSTPLPRQSGLNYPVLINFRPGWTFNVPESGGSVRLSVQPVAGSVVTYLGVRLNLKQGNVLVCDNQVGFATSCTFTLRKADLPPSGWLLHIIVTLDDAPVPGTGQRYVATSGRDGSNVCNVQTDPCLTMQHAMTVSVFGDVINVAAGTYTGRVDVNKAVSLRGASRATTILRGQFSIGGGFTDLTGSVSVEGFTLMPGAGESAGVMLRFLSAASIVTLSQIGASGFDRGVDGILSGGILRITSSAFNNNRNDGIHLEGPEITTLIGLDVIGNAGDGIQFSGVGAATISVSGTRVQDNVEAGVQVEGMPGGTFSLGTTCVVGNGRGPNPQAGVTLSGVDGASFTANGNNIIGNLAGGVDVSTSSTRPNFRNNWWGSPAGPSGSNGATGNVDVSLPAAAPIAGTCL